MDAYHYVSLALGVTGIVACVALAVRPRYRGYLIAPLTWLLNITAFTVWTTFIRIPGTQVAEANQWSILVHIHGLILVSGIALIMLFQQGKR